MGLQGPPYAVLSPLVTDPLAPPGDPESSLFLTCHFVRKGSTSTKSPKWAKLERLMHQERDGSKKGSKKHPKPGLNLLDPTVRLAGGLKKPASNLPCVRQLLRPRPGSNHRGLNQFQWGRALYPWYCENHPFFPLFSTSLFRRLRRLFTGMFAGRAPPMCCTYANK